MLNRRVRIFLWLVFLLNANWLFAETAATNPRLLDCITSWLREIPAAKIVDSPLMDVILKALDNDVSFDAGVDCVCTLYRDPRDVDESLPVIQALYPRLMALRPKIAETAESEDLEAF